MELVADIALNSYHHISRVRVGQFLSLKCVCKLHAKLPTHMWGCGRVCACASDAVAITQHTVPFLLFPSLPFPSVIGKNKRDETCEIKLSLCLTRLHALKAYWEWRYGSTHF